MDTQTLIRQYERLAQDRKTWDSHFEDLAAVMLPRRLGFTSSYVPGERRTDNLFDGTPMQAARGLANAIGGMLRPEGQRWFFLKTESQIEDQSEEARIWLEEAERVMDAALANPKARFRQATGEVDLDLVVFGTGVMFVGEANTLNRLSFQSLHLANTYIRTNDEGLVDTVFRVNEFTARQAVKRWGDKAGKAAQDAMKRDEPDKRIVYVHAVYPREDGRQGARLARNMPFASEWVCRDDKEKVAVGGFPEFPFVVPRWDTSSGEDYGRSPGMLALPDANTLQAQGESLLVAGQRAAEPTILMPDDGTISAPNTAPGGIGYYDAELAREMGRIPIAPLDVSANIPITLELIRDTREQIYVAYFRNVLNLPIDGPQMTATEVIERKEEFIREIGAVFGRLESDYTGPMIERTFNILLRAGAFPEIPPILAGENVRFEYESPVKKVREHVEAQAMNLWFAEIAQVAQVKPEVLDIVNADEYARKLAEIRNIPHELLIGNDQIQAIREARAQAQQAQQQMVLASEGAQIAKTLQEGFAR